LQWQFEQNHYGYQSNPPEWINALSHQVTHGLSSIVANHFGVAFESFPCIVLFKDIRSPEHIVVSLKDFNRMEIAQKFRSLFSVIQMASIEKRNPLEAMGTSRRNETFTKAGKSIFSEIRSIAGKNVEIAMEKLVENVFK
jgi:hypothetical protein